MEPKAENVVQNVGAIAEAISIFYNSMARQVPKDVALVLTRHFMDLTIARRPAAPSLDAAAMVKAAEETRRRVMEHLQKQQSQQTSDSGTGGMTASTKPGTPAPTEKSETPEQSAEQTETERPEADEG